jgi:hypothetical protein
VYVRECIVLSFHFIFYTSHQTTLSHKHTLTRTHHTLTHTHPQAKTAPSADEWAVEGKGLARIMRFKMAALPELVHSPVMKVCVCVCMCSEM